MREGVRSNLGQDCVFFDLFSTAGFSRATAALSHRHSRHRKPAFFNLLLTRRLADLKASSREEAFHRTALSAARSASGHFPPWSQTSSTTRRSIPFRLPAANSRNSANAERSSPEPESWCGGAAFEV